MQDRHGDDFRCVVRSSTGFDEYVIGDWFEWSGNEKVTLFMVSENKVGMCSF